MKDNFVKILEPITVASKDEAYEWISRQAFPDSKDEAQAIQQALLKREEVGDIQIEEGIILPHIEHPALTKTQVWVMRLQQPIVNWSEQIPQVDLIITVLLAENEALAVKRSLADFMRKLADPDYLELLKTGNSAEQ